MPSRPVAPAWSRALRAALSSTTSRPAGARCSPPRRVPSPGTGVQPRRHPPCDRRRRISARGHRDMEDDPDRGRGQPVRARKRRASFRREVAGDRNLREREPVGPRDRRSVGGAARHGINRSNLGLGLQSRRDTTGNGRLRGQRPALGHPTGRVDEEGVRAGRRQPDAVGMEPVPAGGCLPRDLPEVWGRRANGLRRFHLVQPARLQFRPSRLPVALCAAPRNGGKQRRSECGTRPRRQGSAVPDRWPARGNHRHRVGRDDRRVRLPTIETPTAAASNVVST